MRGTVNHGASNVMRSVRLYALIRIAFGVAAVVVPKTTSRAIAGDGEAGDSAAPLAKAFGAGWAAGKSAWVSAWSPRCAPVEPCDPG